MSHHDQITLAEQTIACTIAAVALMVLLVALAYFGGRRRERTRTRTGVARQPLGNKFLIELEPAHGGKRWHWLLFEDAPDKPPLAVGCAATHQNACDDAKTAMLRLIDWASFPGGPLHYRFEQVS